MGFYRESTGLGAAANMPSAILQRPVIGSRPLRWIDVSHQKPKPKRAVPLFRVLGIDQHGKVRYVPKKQHGLTSGQLINRAIGVSTLKGYPAQLTAAGGAEQSAQWGLGEVVQVPLHKLMGTDDYGGLGRSFFQNIGRAISKAAKDVGGAVSRNIKPIASIALAVVGAIIPVVAPISGIAIGLLNKAKAVKAKVPGALQQGGAAVPATAQEIRATAAQSLQVANDPTIPASDRQLAQQIYTNLMSQAASIDGALKQAQATVNGSVPVQLAVPTPAGQIPGSGSLPSWALPAAAAAAAVLLLRK